MAGRGKREKWLYLLAEGDAAQRREAAKKLGELKDASTVPALITALSDQSWRVRRNAVQALGRIGDTRAIEPLITSLSDSSLGVRRQAIIAQGRIGDERSVAPLCETLQQNSEQLTREAMEALQRIGVAAVPGLCRALRSEARVAERAASALVQIHYEQRKYVDVLRAIFEADGLTPEQRWLALETLRTAPHSRWFARNAPIRNIERLCRDMVRYAGSCSEARYAAQVRNAQAILDYMTLARASDENTAGGDTLLRAAQGVGNQPDGAETLLRGSQAASSRETSRTRPGWWARLWERLHASGFFI